MNDEWERVTNSHETGPWSCVHLDVLPGSIGPLTGGTHSGFEPWTLPFAAFHFLFHPGVYGCQKGEQRGNVKLL